MNSFLSPKILLFLLCGSIFLDSSGQQDGPVFTLNDLEQRHSDKTFYNRLNVNPSFFLDSFGITGTLNYSTQHIGYAGSPHGIYTTFESHIANSGSYIGFTGDMFAHSEGEVRRQTYELFYAHQFKIKSDFSIRFGIGFGYLNYKFENAYLVMGEESEWIAKSDNSLLANLGTCFQFYKNTIGISLNDYWAYTSMKESERELFNDVYANVTLSYYRYFRLSSKLSLVPELAFVKTRNDNIVSINSVLDIKKRFQFGLYANTKEEFAFMFTGWISKLFYLGVAFEPTKRISYGLYTYRMGFSIPHF